jgi:vitamin B12 transporter
VIRRPSPSVLPALVSILLLPSAVAAATVAGHVIDPQGAPIARALVRIVGATGAPIAQALTDQDGGFDLSTPERDCRIEVSLVGFRDAVVPCQTGTSLTVTLALAPIEESVVVSATRDEAPTGRVGASVTVFGADQLARQASPLVTATLQSSPGAMVVQSGGAGGVTSLFVRGGESSYNKVLLDGIPLNEPGGAFNFGNLTTANLERVEIIRGANSALFGSDAMTSVVQLFTKHGDADGRLDVTTSVEAGSYGTWQAGAAASGRTGRTDYSAYAGQIHTDNREPNNAFDNTTLSASVGVTLRPGMTLRAIGRGELGGVGTPGPTAFGRPDLDAHFTNDGGVAGVTFEQQVTAAWSQRVTYGLSVSDQASINLVSDPPYLPRYGDRAAPFVFEDYPYDTRSRLHRHRFSYQADWQLGAAGPLAGQVVTAVLDWDGERGTLEDRLAGTAVRAARDNVGWTIQHQALTRRTSLTTGLRLEHNASFGSALVPRVSFAMVVGSGAGWLGETKIKANAGLGVKEPTILQSFSPAPSYLGNPDLQPERARSLDAGIEQRLLGQRMKLELVWFDNRFENQIATTTLGFNPYRAQFSNVGAARARGLELSADAAPVRPLRVRGGYTFLASEVTRSTAPASPVFQEGNWLFRRPRHSGFVDVTWQRSRLVADLRGTFVGRRVDSDFSGLEPPMVWNAAYARWDLTASVRATTHVTAYAAVENLSDAEYMEPLGYPAWRRAARLGARLTF